MRTRSTITCNNTCKGVLSALQARDVFCCQVSLCNYSLLELSNPGASGSIFYISDDDEFIIKTVQHKEADFLQKLLPGYYMVTSSQTVLYVAIFTFVTVHSLYGTFTVSIKDGSSY